MSCALDMEGRNEHVCTASCQQVSRRWCTCTVYSADTDHLVRLKCLWLCNHGTMYAYTYHEMYTYMHIQALGNVYAHIACYMHTVHMFHMMPTYIA